MTSNFDFSIAFWNDGHTRYQTTDDSGGHRFYTRNTTTNTPTQRFQIDHDQIVCSTEFFANNGATIQAATYEDNTNCRVTFLNTNGNTGQVVTNNQLFFNPDNETLRTTNLRATDLAEVLNLRVTGTTNNADFAVDTSANTYGLYATCNDGFVFRMGPNWRLRIYEAPGTGTGTVEVYDDLIVDGSATIDGDITLNTALASSVNRNQNVLFHDNDANDKRIKENNSFYFNPSAEMLTATKINATGTIYNNVLALNYTTVYSCDTWSCSLGTPPYFGNNNYIERDTDNTNFTNPRVSQYGQDIVNSINNTAIRSAGRAGISESRRRSELHSGPRSPTTPVTGKFSARFALAQHFAWHLQPFVTIRRH